MNTIQDDIVDSSRPVSRTWAEGVIHTYVGATWALISADPALKAAKGIDPSARADCQKILHGQCGLWHAEAAKSLGFARDALMSAYSAAMHQVLDAPLATDLPPDVARKIGRALIEALWHAEPPPPGATVIHGASMGTH